MNACELSNLIVDAQPDTHDPDDAIAFSAQSDNQIIRQYFCDPQSGVSILSDYTSSELDGLFSECNTLSEAVGKVESVYSKRKLSEQEIQFARNAVLRVTIDCAIDIATQRRLVGNPKLLEPIIVAIFNDLKTYIGNLGE